jgi:HAD superfamily hydrolase (TIGR01490 family)
MKRKFAAFDIDGTILRNALFFQVIDELIVKGLLPIESKKELDDKFELYRQRKHPEAFHTYSEVAVNTLFSNIHTLNLSDYRSAVDEVIKKSSSHVYVYTRDLISKLKEQGYFLIALSGSEMYAVEQFTKQFDFDLAFGETYVEKDGMLTGEVGEVFRQKDVFLKKFVEEHNLTFKDSFAIGDSLADAKMLELVENPIAYNPEDSLYKLAKEKGWKIVVERKNVVFELERKNGSYILA